MQNTLSGVSLAQFEEFADTVHDYFEIEHAELVPVADLASYAELVGVHSLTPWKTGSGNKPIPKLFCSSNIAVQSGCSI